VKLLWRRIERTELGASKFGVFRFSIYFQPDRHFLCWKNAFFEMPRGAAIYALLHRYRRDVVHYNGTSAVFVVPAACRPPVVLERALVLCSGLRPQYSDSRLFYSDVPLEIARLATELLQQRLT
jgi:hypothetical protein